MNANVYLTYRHSSGVWSTALDIASLEASKGGEYLTLRPTFGGAYRLFPDGCVMRRDHRTDEYSLVGALGNLYRGD